MKTICFDIDGVICSPTDGTYEEAMPNNEIINLINKLFHSGYRIVIHTSRYMGRTSENPKEAYKLGYNQTKVQLENWGVSFHALFMGKPRFDILVDDRSVFFSADLTLLEHEILKKSS